MLYPIKVVDLELATPLPTLEGLDGYLLVWAILRLRGVPIGYLKVPVSGGRCHASTFAKAILDEHVSTIMTCLVREGLLADLPLRHFDFTKLLALPAASDNFWQRRADAAPKVTVAVCTCDRTDDLAICLEALQRLDYPNLDLLVVDNAPAGKGAEELVRTRFPAVRYVCEPRPGLDWARNRAILESQGEIIAYTDDDAIVDPGWAKAIARAFIEQPEVMAVTGLVVPFELETEAQALFELHGGFGRGFTRKWWSVEQGNPVPWGLLGAGQFGTGANMAYRRRLFDRIGDFDPALDVGTVTRGGGDLEMFFRVLKAGHTLMYEPEAMIRHRHRRDYASLKTQITSNGALYALWTSIYRRYPDQRRACLRIGVWWMFHWNIRRWFESYLYPHRLPRDLIVSELSGGLAGLTSYRKALARAQEVEREFGPQTSLPSVAHAVETTLASRQKGAPSIAVRRVELTQPLMPLNDLRDSDTVRLFATWDNRPVGSVNIRSCGPFVGRLQQADGLADALTHQLIAPDLRLGEDVRWAIAISTLTTHLGADVEPTPDRLPEEVSVSIVVATYDRPEDLRNCLSSLHAQGTVRTVEIVVVDNHPASKLTPPVVAEFPAVVLVEERRQGLAYARNAGFIAAKGDILIATDDDVTMPADWLEKLLAPFARADVMVVTGHVLPLELETESQQNFENYGGLGRGFQSFERSGLWFERTWREPVKTWTLGATANAAFRASIFRDSRIGLMEETLGPGMPSGVGEDTYLFYKVLKADFTHVYTPDAYVWHKHRRDDAALRRQLYNYSKGHIAYHLTTWIKDGDWRALKWILWSMPKWQIPRLIKSIIRKEQYPVSLILLEIRGHLMGPWSLWQSYRRVRREGRSSMGPPDPHASVHHSASGDGGCSDGMPHRSL
ncbi:MAG: glycosyltransferase [Thiocapsa sp.]|uniref:glycosyltransferase family 2 protein n=1 Tax=Thiocapsa sp. TaxID=2024551 RepID=UPI001BCFCAEE|nr:glycosyltransferase [Thiocapsa sp.]QVL50330.1 MAG: glycosyltransferase [Thiocapsa sp.]